MPRAQRARWPMCRDSRSVARPAASGKLTNAVRQPLRWKRSAVWASSVTVSTAKPSVSSRASRRITAQEPQKKVAFQKSLPFCTGP